MSAQSDLYLSLVSDSGSKVQFRISIGQMENSKILPAATWAYFNRKAKRMEERPAAATPAPGTIRRGLPAPVESGDWTRNVPSTQRPVSRAFAQSQLPFSIVAIEKPDRQHPTRFRYIETCGARVPDDRASRRSRDAKYRLASVLSATQKILL